jgi:hypothetical protein
LQALTLMNDETYVELALAFAQRVLKETSGQALEEQLRYAFRCALSRAPRAEELEVLATIYREELDQAGGDQLIAGIKGFKPDPALDHRKLAAWFHLASVLLNLDETINKS